MRACVRACACVRVCSREFAWACSCACRYSYACESVRVSGWVRACVWMGMSPARAYMRACGWECSAWSLTRCVHVWVCLSLFVCFCSRVVVSLCVFVCAYIHVDDVNQITNALTRPGAMFEKSHKLLVIRVMTGQRSKGLRT